VRESHFTTAPDASCSSNGAVCFPATLSSEFDHINLIYLLLYLCTPAEADASMADEEALYCSEDFLHVVGRRHHHRSGGFPITKASESDQFAWQIEQHPILFALHPPNVLRSR
jgi:hypothetical protein